MKRPASVRRAIPNKATPLGERGNGFCCSREPHVWMAENCARLKKQFSGTGNVQTKKTKEPDLRPALGVGDKV